MKVTVNIDARKILAERGLGSSKKAQKALAADIVRLADPYVPMSSGSGAHMKNQKQIAPDGSQIVYEGPYAHYQYYGEVMAGRAPKSYTGRKLTYNGAPMRGARWIERMVADKKKELEDNVEAYVRR
ncbi:MAG: capsid protein [Clostridia bacterium]|nr:capsid protein [Clostridia bacterium]